jgi:hypothetical protein
VQSHFNGAYVPARTNSLIHLTVLACGPLKHASVIVRLRSDNDQSENDCVGGDGCGVVIVSNLRVLQEVEVEHRMAATDSTFAWIARVLEGLTIGSIREVTALDPRCTNVWQHQASRFESSFRETKAA